MAECGKSNDCGKIQLVISKDGSFEVKGELADKLYDLFPNLEVVPIDGGIEIKNFYYSKGKPTWYDGGVISDNVEFLADSFLVSDGVLTLSPSSEFQTSVWAIGGGTGTNKAVSAYSENFDENAPSLVDAIRAYESPETIPHDVTEIRIIAESKYLDDIVEACNLGYLDANRIAAYSYGLSITGSPTGDFINDARSKILDVYGIAVKIDHDCFKTSNGNTITYTGGDSVTVRLSPRYFCQEAKDYFCTAFSDMFNGIVGTKTLILDDYFPYQQWGEAILSEDELLESLLSTLLKMKSCGIDLSNTTVSTILGTYDPNTKEFTYETPFYKKTNENPDDPDEYEIIQYMLDTDIRFEYSAGVIAVLSQLVGGMSWSGVDQCAPKHAVMAAASLISTESLTVTSLNKLLGVTIDKENSVLSWRTLFLQGTPPFPIGYHAYIRFLAGEYDVTVDRISEIDNQDNPYLFEYEEYVSLYGSSKYSEGQYLVPIEDKSLRPKFDTYNGLFLPDMMGDIDFNGSVINMSSGVAQAQKTQDIADGFEFVKRGASKATGTDKDGYYFEITPDSFYSDNPKYNHMFSPTMGSFNTPYINFDGSVVVLKDKNGIMDAVRIAVATGTPIDITNVDVDAIFDMPTSINYIVSDDQLGSVLVDAVYGMGYSINKETELQSSVECIDKYYKFILKEDGNIVASCMNGISYLDSSPIGVMKTSYLSMLDSISSSITGGTTNNDFKKIVDNTPTVENGSSVYLNAILSKVQYSTEDHEGHSTEHNDVTYRVTISDFVYSSTKVDSDECSSTEVTLAEISIENFTYSMSIVNSRYSSTKGSLTKCCPYDGKISSVETSEAPEPLVVDTDNIIVKYTMEKGSDGELIVSYEARDKDGNDVTDAFNTLTVGDNFIHKDL